MRERTTEELKYLAYHDQLTGAYNRNYLEDIREDYDSQELYVTMVDIDGLKELNDTYGHEHGDLFIKSVCGELESFGEPLFRLGGDEFS